MTIHVCTIAARNYLPYVRTLATSFKEVHPDGHVSALIFDDLHGRVSAESEPFELLHLEDLGEDMAEFHRMAMLYDLMEFATALKPWLLQSLLDGGSDPVLYLDPDIEVFSSLEDLANKAIEHGIVLTPHTTTPYPLDKKGTDDQAILASGIFNLGFIGVGKQADSFLAFWKERLRRECRNDVQAMRFVDQRWIDFVPGCFDHAIIRDPQYNVAYWNLHGRNLRWTGTEYQVNGQPLAFFHFSGYSPEAGQLLSRHQGDRPRILLSDNPDLARICDEYRDLLYKHGYGVDNLVPYELAVMADGTPVDRFIRHIYNGWVEDAEDRNTDSSCDTSDSSLQELPPDAFDVAKVNLVIDQLNRPPQVEGDPGNMSIYMATRYALSPELHDRFPDPQGTDRVRFLTWAMTEAVAGRFPRSLAVPPIKDTTPAADEEPPIPTPESLVNMWAAPDHLYPGIVVTGYLKAELGIGEEARLAVRAIEATDIPFSTVCIRTTMSRQRNPFAILGDNRRDLDVNLVVVNADEFANFTHLAGTGFFAGRYTIGQWAWELEEFPERFWPALDLVDEVWANSKFSRSAIAAVTEKPVFALPPRVAIPDTVLNLDRSAFGLPTDSFLFLFTFDMLSIFERKNPLGLVTAFAKAFKPGEGPLLVLKVINGERRIGELERLRLATKERPDIILIDRYLDHDKNAALSAMADCYVSLHRSEGLGLTIAEALALGKPVIATGYSGNLDFMDDDIAYLVPWTRGSVPGGCKPYPEGAKWAEPDIAMAAEIMRYVFDHPEEAAAKGARARERMLREYTVDARAAFIKERFSTIQKGRAAAIQAFKQKQAEHSTPSQRTLQRIRSSRVGAAARQLLPTFVVQQLRKPKRIDYLHTGYRGDIAKIESHQAELMEWMANLMDGPPSLTVIRDSVLRLRSVPYMAESSTFATIDQAGRCTLAYDIQEGDSTLEYAGFEDTFRGSRETVRNSFHPYLDHFIDAAPVLDLGCGRGEMLDLFRDAGIDATGVDLDISMVERCKEYGHDVVHGDGIEYLTRCEAESVGGIFCAQVVEHLKYDQLITLLRESLRVLRPGGPILLETVNIHALQAFKTFWTDPSHCTPLFPEVLLAFCRDTGFVSGRVIFPNGVGNLQKDLWSEGSYAVVATKQPPILKDGQSQ